MNPWHRALSQIAAVGLLLAATFWIPWVHYQVGHRTATSLNPGRYTQVLAVAGVAALAIAAVQLRLRAQWAGIVGAATGVLATAFSILAAGTRIAHANNFTLASNGGGSTAFAIGALSGVVASVCLIVLPLLPTSRRSRRAPVRASCARDGPADTSEQVLIELQMDDT